MKSEAETSSEVPGRFGRYGRGTGVMDGWLPWQESVQVILAGIVAQVREFHQELEEISIRDPRKFCVNDKLRQYEKLRLGQEWK